MYNIFKNSFYTFKIAWKIEKKFILVVLFENILQMIATLAAPLLLSVAVYELENKYELKVVILTALIISIFLCLTYSLKDLVKSIQLFDIDERKDERAPNIKQIYIKDKRMKKQFMDE